MNIHSGEFKHPVSIERYISETNDDLIPIEKWETVLKTKAKIKNMSGYEKIITSVDTSINKKRFYIRYKRDLNLTTKDKIIYNKQSYNITYVSDVEEQHRYYEIVGELVE
ncbi:phage head closure protein [Clostridium butyricum]|uniref:phage head closure protein n=1 Tax=Clostridium butyricum TaxID=1492 RepID=UPI002AAF19D7|nr:phage head closure protein [Clostridium butyricum]